MDRRKKDILNAFFVKVFNQILSWEEQSFREMGLKDISLRELHVIEVVYYMMKGGRNSMANIAGYLSITPGSLTTSVNGLVKKGYLERRHSEEDRRIVKIFPTKKAEDVYNIHSRFHTEMIDEVEREFEEDEMETLVRTLRNLSVFFEGKCTTRRA